MEKPKKTRTNEQEMHKMAIRVGGGGGVGGVVIWGGALAIATLVSVSAIKLRNRRSTTKTLPPPPPPPPVVSTDLQSNKLELNNNKDEGSDGLRALLQHPSPPIHHHTSSDGATNMGMIQIDSTSLILPESLILNNSQNENSTNGDQKIIFSDDPKSETRGLAIDDDDVQVEAFYLPISESLSLIKPEKVNEYTEDLLVSEVIEVANDEKAIEAPNADQIEVEESPQMQSVGGGEEEYGDGENIVEKGVKVETTHADQIAIEDDPQAQLNQKEEEEEEEEDNDEDKEEVIAEKGVTVETARADKIAVEEDPQAQLIEEEEDNEEGIVEKGVTVETARADKIAVEEDPQAQLIEEEEDNEEGIVEKGVTVETAPEDQIAVEEDPQAQLSEEEEEEENFDDDDDDDEEEEEEEEDIVERGEESSEGSGDSSMESNAEAIWPAESMQELSEEFKELKIDNQKLGDKIEEDTTEDGCLNKNEMSNINYDYDSEERVKSTEVLRQMINQPTKSSNLSIWIWSMLVVLLLLVVPLLLSLTQIPHV